MEEELAWVPFGPSDPTFPTPSWPVYNAFANGRCAELERALQTNDVADFGRAMLAVCLAAIDGRQDRWAVASAQASADPEPLANSCLAKLVKTLLDEALVWHHRHPGKTPVVRFDRVQGQTECGKRDGPPPPSETTPGGGGATSGPDATSGAGGAPSVAEPTG